MASGIQKTHLNPYNHELNCKTGSAATIVSALAAIGMLVCVFTLLASQGIHLGPLNALSSMSPWIFGPLTGAFGLLSALTGVWWLLKIKEGCTSKGAKAVLPKDPTPKQKTKTPIASSSSSSTEALPQNPIHILGDLPPQSPLDPYYTAAVQLTETGTVIDEKKRDELIECVHQMDSLKELYEITTQVPADFYFLRMLIKCRITRVTLKDRCPFDFEKDIVIPVCNQGKYRSPALYGTLKLIYPELTVLDPHGAIEGFDPGDRLDWAGLADYDDMGHKEGERDDVATQLEGFRLIYGIDKPKRFGLEKAKELGIPLGTPEWNYYSGVKCSAMWGEIPTFEDKERANLKENDKIVTQLKTWMEENLFGMQKKNPDKRVIFIPATPFAYIELSYRFLKIVDPKKPVATHAAIREQTIMGAENVKKEEERLRNIALERKKAVEDLNMGLLPNPLDYDDTFRKAKTPKQVAQETEKLAFQFNDDLMDGKVFS